jgi:hypothetical protein
MKGSKRNQTDNRQRSQSTSDALTGTWLQYQQCSGSNGSGETEDSPLLLLQEQSMDSSQDSAVLLSQNLKLPYWSEPSFAQRVDTIIQVGEESYCTSLFD